MKYARLGRDDGDDEEEGGGGGGDATVDLDSPSAHQRPALRTCALSYLLGDITNSLKDSAKSVWEWNLNVKVAIAFCFGMFATLSIFLKQLFVGYVYLIGDDSATLVGYVSAVQGIVQMFSGVPAGVAADRISRQFVLRVAGVLGLASIVISVLAFTVGSGMVWPLYVVAACWGAFNGINFPAVESIFADSVPTGTRTRLYSIKYSLERAASALGPLLAILMLIFIGDKWDIDVLRVVLLVGTLLALAPCCCLFLFRDSATLGAESGSVQSLIDAKADSHSNDDDDDDDGDDVEMGVIRDDPETDFEVAITNVDDDEHEDDDDARLRKRKATHRHSDNGDGDIGDDDDEKDTAGLIKSLDPAATSFSEGAYHRFARAAVPFVVAGHDVAMALGAGMSVQFFPLFFKNEFGFDPIAVSLIYLFTQLFASVMAQAGQWVSVRVGRIEVIVGSKALSICCLLGMIITRNRWMAATLFILRSSLANCARPLLRSLLMDFSKKEHRGRWNAVDSVARFGWTGSAAVGGWLVDAYGYRVCFGITALVYTCAVSPLLALWPVIPRERVTEVDVNSKDATEANRDVGAGHVDLGVVDLGTDSTVGMEVEAEVDVRGG